MGRFGTVGLVVLMAGVASVPGFTAASDLIALEVSSEVAAFDGPAAVAGPLGSHNSPGIFIDGASGLLMAVVDQAGNAADTSGLGAVALPFVWSRAVVSCRIFFVSTGMAPTPQLNCSSTSSHPLCTSCHAAPWRAPRV